MNQSSDFMTLDMIQFLPEDCQKYVAMDKFKNMMVLFARQWDTQDCKESPESLFIFGDNDICQGNSEQAVIRNCTNTIGIPTKKLPNNETSSFYVDDDYETNCFKIFTAVVKIIRMSARYQELIFPSEGFGTGYEKMSLMAPKTQAFMEKLIDDCFGIDYQDIRKNGLRIDMSVPKEVTQKV